MMNYKKNGKKRIDAARRLGEYGWTVSPSKTPSNVCEWINVIMQEGESAIARKFTQKDIEEIFTFLKEIYSDNSTALYLQHAIDNYRKKNYTEAAMFFFALLDNRVFYLASERYPYNKRKQIENGINESGKKYYQCLRTERSYRLFVACDYIPSLIAYCMRVFNDAKGFECYTGNVPPYLNRNWLHHGRMAREVKKYEVIQIINALDTAAELEDMMEEIWPWNL